MNEATEEQLAEESKDTVPDDLEMSKNFVEVQINKYTAKFPFKPYDIQKNYMFSVIKACAKKENALLESPTGTGKTLSLL